MSSETSYRTQTNVLIPMRDGITLAARLYLPATDTPAPAIVSMMPYHKDGSASSGYLDAVHQSLAADGYATLTVDLRGLGNSEGVATNAFAASERHDGYDLIEWVSAQDWCSGRVGMWGVSYGGITSLSTAAVRPPSLKAIIPIHAATDMYRDYLVAHGCRTSFSPDVHWAIRMAASNLLPPIHDVPNGDEIWRERLETYRPWIINWHERGTYDDYWREAATRPEEITVPTYVVGGWRDIFADISVATFQRLAGPKKLVIGPWKHVFPDLAATAPIGFMSQMKRWWARWLRDEQNGIDEEPPITHYVYGANEWRDEDQWPPAGTTETRYWTTGDGALTQAAGSAPVGHDPLPYRYNPLAGLDTIAMHWLPGPDQPVPRFNDAERSLCFDLPPLASAIDIVGTPKVRLTFSGERRNLPLVARLFALDEDGNSRLITMGWTREAGATPDAPEPGRPRDVEVELRPIAWRLAAGSTLRLTVSCADFSRIWPEPEPFTLELYQATLTLHLREPGTPAPAPAWIGPPELATAPRELAGERQLDVTQDLLSSAASLRTRSSQSQVLDHGAHLESTLSAELTVVEPHPSQANLQAEATFTLRRRSGVVTTRATLVETLDRIHVEVEVTLGGSRLYSGTWSSAVNTPMSK